GGWHESKVPQISMHVPEGGFAFLAREVKRAVKIPVIACNRINNREIAEDILNEGYSDFVGCCRAFLIDSEFGNKIKTGKKYRKCIGCNNCIENVLKGDLVSCAFNPSLCNENKTENDGSKKNEKVLIIGGGPSGIEAALQYIGKGYSVRICTKEESIGGLMKFASKAPYKNAIKHNIKTMEAEMLESGVEVFCQTFVDEIYINDYHPDLVVVATGSEPLIPNIEGINKDHVYLAQDILAGERNLTEKLLAGKVLIVGGGSVGLETALYLINESHMEKYSRQFLDLYIDSRAYEALKCSSNITIVEMDKFGQDLKSTRWITLKELERWHVRLMSHTKVEKILNKEVVTKTGDLSHNIEADYVVLAVGYQSVGKELVKWLEENKYDCRLIGDAKKVGNISNAIKDGYELN
ncbi:MAG TPA: FAD-dependent oxidoreductase, partial [Anaerovoracaceae bacterium]|nr:FAD-dependent oxidoreductase [Anaerovoracaceae bacterium]